MRTRPKRARLGVVLMTALSVAAILGGGIGIASAQLAPSNSQIQFNVVTTTTTTTTVPATTTTTIAAAHATQSSLPLTGGPVLQMVLTAVGLTVLGVTLVTVGRRRRRA